MIFKTILQRALALLLAAMPVFAFAQVTTAALSGQVTGDGKEDLVGASIKAVHQPSGTVYGITTRDDGSYTIANMRVGGPYTITANLVGYQEQKFDNIFLNLGQKLRLDFNLVNTAGQLGEVVISVDPILNGERTGAATNVTSEQLRVLPTISRSASDYYRLTPMSDGNSFGGRNDQFNNFSLDGAIFNNPFGLDAATPGGQTDAQPISLDAIDQIQVSIAPYDVTQAGFTGAAINTVTKSGTNEFKGTVFGFYRNQNLTGSKIADNEVFRPDLTQVQSGFSLGGPIVKNKVFFFVNAEIDRREDLGSSWRANRGTTGELVSRVSASDLDAVQAALRGIGYETGPYENYTLNTQSNKAIFKLDFNLSANHKLTTTFNYLDAYKEKPAHPAAIFRRGPDATTLQFKNSGYRINNVIYSGIAELKSTFGNKFSNKLQVGRSAFRDARDPFSTPAPVINIKKDGVPYIVAGHEPFSIHNLLDQDVWQVNDNFNIYLNKHTLTVGAAFEKFLFNNSFNLGVYDAPTYPGGTFGPGYASVADFLAAVDSGFVSDAIDFAKASAARPENKWADPETNLGQISAYIQDEIALGKDFTLTLGLRADRPEYFDTKAQIEKQIDTSKNCCYFPFIEYSNPETGEKVSFDHTVLPEEKILFSPRLGFNWDIKGDRSQQLRGGSGLFTGRFPFVWIGNQVANPNFYFYCVTDPDFKFPQVWRSNLGYDQKFKGGWIGSVDLVYTKDVNAVMVRNYGIRPPSGTLPGVDNRKIYTGADRTSFANDAYVVTNTDLGYTFNASFQVQREWSNGLYTSLGYNFGVSEDAASIDAEISSDAFQRNPAFGNVNQAVLTNSLYGNRHRVVGSAHKKFTYSNGKLATTVALFMQYVQGGRYSWTYSGDINGDFSGLNDLIYIPTDAEIDQMRFKGDADQIQKQRSALKSFIAQDGYLNDNRGGYAEKYANLSPWYSNWDLRILQDLNLERAGTFQLSIDVLNIGNLLHADWGLRQIPTNSQPIGVSIDGDTGEPVYEFDPNQKTTFSYDPSLLSRWQAQVGLRYIF